jgi:hypothetical protein
MSRKANFAIFGIIIVIILVLSFWYWQKSEERYKNNIDAANVVEITINNFDESQLETFLNIQDINDLGNHGIEPLLDRADSKAIKDQWTSVVGLNTIARGLNKKDCIINQMKAFSNSPFLTIQLYAAASLAENGDLSGKDVLLKGLESNEMMMFMQPPKSAKTFANNVLEYATDQNFNFKDASNPADEKAAIDAWKGYLEN